MKSNLKSIKKSTPLSKSVKVDKNKIPKKSLKSSFKKHDSSNLAFVSDKPRNLFKFISDLLYTTAIGILLGSFILFFCLAIILNDHVYVNFSFYTGLGLLIYLLSYIFFVFLRPKQVILSEEFDKKYKVLFLRFFVTTFFLYLLLSWFLMIMIGSFDFHLRFINNPTINAFTLNQYQTKITGFILFYITIGIAVTLLVIHLVYIKFKHKANITFTLRRKMVEKVRSDAEKAV